MHDLDRVQLESTYNQEFGDETDELAYQLLEVADEEELDQFLGDLINNVRQGVGQAWNSSVGRAIRPHLKAAATAILPKAIPQIGGFIGRQLGQENLGRQLGDAVLKASRKRWSFEGEVGEGVILAREFVDVAQEIGQMTAAMAQHMTPPTAAARAVQSAIGRRVVRTRPPGGSGRSGTWVRRGNSIVLKGIG